jgi:hypothetical protein
MQALKEKIISLKDKNPACNAIEAALYACNHAKVPFSSLLIVCYTYIALIAKFLPEAAELLPFINAAIVELSAACKERDREKYGLAHAFLVEQATIVSCEAMKKMMSSKDFTLAISLIPCTCMPQYFDAVKAISTLTVEERLSCYIEALCTEQAVVVACAEICVVVQEALRK